jgi:sugar lactone lactonase YvrE
MRHSLSLLTRTAVALAAMAAFGSAAIAATKVYTLDADFSLGLLENLNFAAPNSNQLQVNTVGVGSKYLFIANHDESTVSKFDTVLNREVARYRTGSPNEPTYPSRIAIDLDGNAYVLGRDFASGKPPQLIKVLVDTAIDRNGNSLVDSSVDTNNDGVIQPSEILAFTQNDTGANNAVFADERIAWARRIGTGVTFGRSICIAPDGKLWVGIWDQARYYRVDPANGAVLPIPGSGAPYVQMSAWNPYGCTIDKNGILWSATLSQRLGRVDTNTGAVSHFDSPFGSTYGIAQGNGKIYQANLSGFTWNAFDPVTNTFTAPATLQFGSAGIAVDGAGNIVSTDFGGVSKFAPNGSLLWSRGAQAGAFQSYGVMVDGNNDVWTMNIGSNNISKYRGTDGASLGVFPVGAFPYVYTDGSGLTTRNQTNNRQGTWTVVYDGGAAGTPWGKINWNDVVPSGASVSVEARSADTQPALELANYAPVAKNVNLTLSGRYIQMRSRLVTNNAGDTPVLLDLTVQSRILTCDVDSDSDVDSSDVNAIRAAIGQTPTPGDPRDANGDGQLTMNDARACVLQCTRPKCATN